MRVLLWGTYDTGKPRVRILRQGLLECGVDVAECHVDLWSGIEDKSRIRSLRRWFSLAFHGITVYPRLVWRFLREPKPDLVLICYPGLIDVLVLRLFAWWRGTPVVWDWFISAYDTIVLDRQLLGRRNPVSWLVWLTEWLAARCADLAFMDTRTHAARLESVFCLQPRSVGSVWVGAETLVFSQPASDPSLTTKMPASRGKLKVLFYGQFIPLHGLDVIVKAARQSPGGIHWIIIGQGQEAARIRQSLDKSPVSQLTWIEWIKYDELVQWIRGSDICLGIFGGSGKAASVIPNKVFQIIAAGKPLITRDSPAIRELLDPPPSWARLIPHSDPRALLAAIQSLSIEPGSGAVWRSQGSPIFKDLITPVSIGRQFLALIRARIPEVSSRCTTTH